MVDTPVQLEQNPGAHGAFDQHLAHTRDQVVEVQQCRSRLLTVVTAQQTMREPVQRPRSCRHPAGHHVASGFLGPDRELPQVFLGIRIIALDGVDRKSSRAARLEFRREYLADQRLHGLGRLKVQPVPEIRQHFADRPVGPSAMLHERFGQHPVPMPVENRQCPPRDFDLVQPCRIAKMRCQPVLQVVAAQFPPFPENGVSKLVDAILVEQRRD